MFKAVIRCDLLLMAVLKRKSLPESKNDRPEKRPKPTISSKLSALREEEPAFPRGGASILTPLEHKQIKIKANKDVLFEQTTGQKLAQNEFENDGDLEDVLEIDKQEPAKRRKRVSKDASRRSVEASKEAGIRIEGLSYNVCIKECAALMA